MVDEPSEPGPAPSAFAALAGGRCPRCRQGRIFRGTLSMNPSCPHCGLQFEREHGYFTGAMYFSYGLGIPIIAVFTGLAWLVFPTWPLWQLVALAWVWFLPLVPLVYRISRVGWIHLDRALDRDDETPGDGESGPLN